MMTNNIEIQKLKSEYPEFFGQFSPKLLDFIFSQETSAKIAEICLENGVEEEEKIEKIAYRFALAALNQIPKENLAEVLVKGVGLSHQTAINISAEIKRLIVSKVSEIQPEETPQIIEKDESQKSHRKDIYRERV